MTQTRTPTPTRIRRNGRRANGALSRENATDRIIAAIEADPVWTKRASESRIAIRMLNIVTHVLEHAAAGEQPRAARGKETQE